MIHRLLRQQVVPAAIDDVWAYFATPHNLNEITPPNMNFEIIHGGMEKMFPGQLIEYRVQFIPLFKSHWLTEIAHVEENHYFVDEQRRGPYRFWYHEHLFTPTNEGTQIMDHVTYELPFGLLGESVHALWVKMRLKNIFDYREIKIKHLFGV